MNMLQNWAFNMLKTHFGRQFESVVGMSVDDAMKACSRGDQAALNKISAYGIHLQQQFPDACRNAESWARTAFSGASVPAEKQNNTNPTKLERTQYNELQ